MVLGFHNWQDRAGLLKLHKSLSTLWELHILKKNQQQQQQASW
jgi:hypothetical protein